MEKVAQLQPGTYVMAVSGGVDSMALMHCLVQQNLGSQFIAAHFDHGIRPDSYKDKLLVEKMARKYKVRFEAETAALGPTASEELARTARYNFLHRTKQKYAANAIITAHHSDDVIETMIINLLRGSGWRGLCSLRDHPALMRPLLAHCKQDIVEYAQLHNLDWREDSTNSDLQYLRNNVRSALLPCLDKKKWLELFAAQQQLQGHIEKELQTHASWRRHDFIMWPPSVALEVLRARLSLTRPQARRVLMAIKTARPGHKLTMGRRTLAFTREEFMVE